MTKAKRRLITTASGDSYTSIDFNPKKEQPSLSNPFGNPSLPKPSSIHQKWIHYLTMNYNSSAIQTYNMASYGATMDGFVRFYHEHFMPNYGINNHAGAAGWNATNSLFATFFGINDVRRCTDQPSTRDNCSEIYGSLFAIYRFLLEQVRSLFPHAATTLSLRIHPRPLNPPVPTSSTPPAPATSSSSTSPPYPASPSPSNGATPSHPPPSQPGTPVSYPSPPT